MEESNIVGINIEQISNRDHDPLPDTVIRILKIAFSGILCSIGIFMMTFPVDSLDFFCNADFWYDRSKPSLVVQAFGLTCISCGFIIPTCIYRKRALVGLVLSNIFILFLAFRSLFWNQNAPANGFIDLVVVPLAIIGLTSSVAGYLIMCVWETEPHFKINLNSIPTTQLLFTVIVQGVALLSLVRPSAMLEFFLDCSNSPAIDVAANVLQYFASVMMILSSLTGNCDLHSVAVSGMLLPILAMTAVQRDFLLNPILLSGDIYKIFLSCCCLVVVHEMGFVFGKPAPKLNYIEDNTREEQDAIPQKNELSPQKISQTDDIIFDPSPK